MYRHTEKARDELLGGRCNRRHSPTTTCEDDVSDRRLRPFPPAARRCEVHGDAVVLLFLCRCVPSSSSAIRLAPASRPAVFSGCLTQRPSPFFDQNVVDSIDEVPGFDRSWRSFGLRWSHCSFSQSSLSWRSYVTQE
ncbi:hypothetical protein E3N88_14581 [Mikania micrantha]|uniref:Uncharacterized protein n=1 Tax=Mikania micrantha TaxID=192012 RepID=A0A5N6P3J6_9ASTR|nr:hypothetical protein E3N88_14581 [Mikania micrantha]